jgi:hypothetical protein
VARNQLLHPPSPTRAPTDAFADAAGQEEETSGADVVHLRIQQRNGKKSLTTVQVRARTPPPPSPAFSSSRPLPACSAHIAVVPTAPACAHLVQHVRPRRASRRATTTRRCSKPSRKRCVRRATAHHTCDPP